MIEAIVVKGLEKIEDIHVIRNEIHLTQEDSLKLFRVDSFDEKAIHVIVYEGQRVVATGRLLIFEEYIVDKVCVRIVDRKNHYGDLVVKMLIDKAFTMGARKVVALVPDDITGFFSRIGFVNEEELDGLNKMTITKESIIKCKH
ncbi:MAG: hypothetical protein CVU84_12940 [Firmicutes bacterium HGW-Firmicutes-1]|jgi:predicted GNAT family N-acyltransferase|nr:MAG: hypothetical protein CVU84_12940 [Firmicutes bacterium HGW-Firmicutes-1]